MKRSLFSVLLIIIMLLGLLIMASIFYQLIAKEICYNLPLGEFYRSEYCERFR